MYTYPNYYQTPVRAEVFSNRIIKVYGTGKVAVEPNIVSIQLGVITENQSLLLAQQENARLMNQVIQALLELGVSQKDIQTSSYNIRPISDFKDGEPVNQRYQVVNTVQVTITDFDQIGTIIDRAVQEGVNRVFAIQFSTNQQETIYNQALQNALEDGARKARTIAQKFHLPLDPTPFEIIEQTVQPLVAHKAFSTSVENFTTTPIQSGQIEIEATVELVYKY
ncbi:SIMPL domain-containing protein [Virgibacillus pantothenticus]|uniref:SIMPL domain-containing protein n=1 Tax=Virgibacillus pantothenticus TaxID=1473 RepID=UPI0009876EC2|nr:SIMPL domain-containing protein [Virgibacillus pantothenticus]MBU8568010.1 SIMPL domain-containing protein [Virgibacillus pantothenticus]MBU8601734.1 SIMPL domain-containing protein [Virgibacillus pantothenticus]MBU8636108.1 SIMPL domain-containing protein [Virgibacillus pantothenticus]MBU8643571.1 SIMPL domain-containing protein [Virgibacillus pantothenticus]MBU8647712.1 SIMPL domain-containing protein [Virgibacillus pantothenticus]